MADQNQDQAKPKAKGYTVRVLRDFWPTEDQRVKAGTILENIEADAAIEGIESGILERVKA